MRRACHVGKADNHAHGAVHIRREIDGIEIRRVPLGFIRSAFQMRLNRIRPAARASGAAAERVGQCRNHEIGSGEMTVERTENDAHAAALARAAIGEAVEVHVGTFGEPVDRAVDAEDDGIEVCRLARFGKPGRRILARSVLRAVHRIDRVPLRLRALEVIFIGFKIVDRKKAAYCIRRGIELQRPETAAGAGHFYPHGKRRTLFIRRHRHKPVNAPPERGETDFVEIIPRGRFFRDALHLGIQRHLGVETIFGGKPERKEITRTGCGRIDFLRFERDGKIQLTPLDRLGCTVDMQAQKARFRERSGEREHIGLRKVNVGSGHNLRPEVVEAGGKNPLKGSVRIVLRRYRESRRLATAVKRLRAVGFDRKGYDRVNGGGPTGKKRKKRKFQKT